MGSRGIPPHQNLPQSSKTKIPSGSQHDSGSVVYHHAFTPQSLKLYVDSLAVGDVSNDILLPLASDVTYRVKELIQKSCQFMRHARREKLTIGDVKRAMEVSKIPMVFGHGDCSRQKTFTFIPEAGVWSPNNEVISLQTECSTEIDLDEYNSQLDMEVSLEGDDATDHNTLREEEHKVYSELATAIMNKNPPIANYAFRVLRDNGKISRVLIWILKDMLKLTRESSSDTVLTRVQTVLENIIANKKIKLYSRSLRDLMFEILLFQIEEVICCGSAIWLIKEKAVGLIIAFLERQHLRKEELYQVISKRMVDILLSGQNNPLAYYGPILTLTKFGPHIHDTFLFLLPRLHHLANLEDQDQSSAHHPTPSPESTVARGNLRVAVHHYLHRLLHLATLQNIEAPLHRSLSPTNLHPIVAQSTPGQLRSSAARDIYATFVDSLGDDMSPLAPSIEPFFILDESTASRQEPPQKPPNLSLAVVKSDPDMMKPRRKKSTGSRSRLKPATMKNMGWRSMSLQSGTRINRPQIQFRVDGWTSRPVRVKRTIVEETDTSKFASCFLKCGKFLGARPDGTRNSSLSSLNKYLYFTQHTLPIL